MPAYRETDSGLFIPRTELDDYFTTHYTRYRNPPSIGYSCIGVLDFLNGQPLNELALDYIHALRPTGIRITEGEVKCDAMTWRVTVYVHKSNGEFIIRRIEQEVEVGLRTAETGHHLACMLKLQRDQCAGNVS